MRSVAAKWIFACLLLSATTGSDAQKKQSSPATDTVAVGKQIMPVAQSDSTDRFLSTDSNTRDVSMALDNLYVPDEQDTRHVPGDTIRRYKAETRFAYANDPEYWKRDPPPKEINIPALVFFFRLFLILCAALLVFGIYRLVKDNFSGLFSRKPKSRDGNPATGIPEEASLSTAGLEKRLAEAINAGDWRTAVRMLYLRLIRALEDRQLLPQGRLATNNAWASVFRDPGTAAQFRALAGLYEYVVYGGFDPDRAQFTEIQKRFADFSQKLPA